MTLSHLMRRTDEDILKRLTETGRDEPDRGCEKVGDDPNKLFIH